MASAALLLSRLLLLLLSSAVDEVSSTTQFAKPNTTTTTSDTPVVIHVLEYVTSLQLIELTRVGSSNPSEACPNGYKPVRNQLLVATDDEWIAKLALSPESYYVVCYATSRLVHSGERVASSEFLQSIAFDMQRPREERVLLHYNRAGLELRQETNITKEQVNTW